MADEKGKTTVESRDRIVFRAVLDSGSLCASQASLKTGIGLTDLRGSLTRLKDRGLIKPVPAQTRESDEFLSYEADLA